MGLHIQSLENFPEEAKRAYYIYLLDYGWSEPLGEALFANFEKMASLASGNNAVVIRGTERVHFEDEVLSWHHINGENANNLLPAILITNKHPKEFKDTGDNAPWQRERQKIILIPLKKVCKTTNDVVNVIQQIFSDIKNKKELSGFKIQKKLKKGIGGAIVDALELTPNFGGAGINLKKIADYFTDDTK